MAVKDRTLLEHAKGLCADARSTREKANAARIRAQTILRRCEALQKAVSDMTPNAPFTPKP